MMRNNFRHSRWLVLALILAAALSGCYRSVGGSLEPTPSNVNVTQIANNTPIPMPTFTALPEETVIEPTAEEITALPSPIPASPTDEIDTAVPTEEEALPDGQGGFAGPTPTRTAIAAVIAPSFTPVLPTQVVVVPSSTPTVALPTPIPTEPPTLIPTQITAIGPTPTFTYVPYNPPLPSATYTPFVPPQEGQPLGERPTDTLVPGVDGQGGPVATESPLAVAQVATSTLTVNQVTATAIIAGATMTAAAGQGTLFPTQQPIPGQVTGVTPLPTVAVGPTAIPGQCNTHLISPGETLSRIALQYNVTTQQIAQANNIVNPDLILAGNTLSIPCPVPATPGAPTAAPAASGITTNTSGPFNYIVEPGDNLYRISLRYGVSMAALMQANGLTPATINVLYAGQQLYIPAAAAQPVVVTPLPTATLQLTG